jgi:phospho-N-acetylmuramoyl-pentapeptide-transferase
VIPFLVAGFVSTVLALLATPLFIKFLRRHDIGQEIREDGPSTHLVKHGTPTMGGVVILAAAAFGYLASHLPFLSPRPITVKGLLVLLAAGGLGLIGFLDDYLKYRNQRSLGLNKRAKIIGQVSLALVFAVLLQSQTSAVAQLSFVRPFGPELPIVVFTIWVLFVFIASSNAVNLTDGLDGLAAGSSSFVFLAFLTIAFWQFRHPDFYFPNVSGDTVQALDLAVVAAAFAGACGGFLWWNTNPAKIFMGDTGSLGLGGALAALAFLTNTQLLLPILGGLFVLETISVIAQVFSFKVFGRRVLRMAPLHHHFELRGWPETTVIVRFWMIAAAFVITALAIFYTDWLRYGAVA